MEPGSAQRVAIMEEFDTLREPSALGLSRVNHLSRKVSSVKESKRFYENFLGFVQVQRPRSFGFTGAWLFNYGIGIHLLQCDECTMKERDIDPQDDHISFQCEDIDLVEEKLREHGIRYLRRKVEQEDITVDQVFFFDPDGFMIEVCNCDQLPVVPLALARAASLQNLQQRVASCNCKSSECLNSNGTISEVLIDRLALAPYSEPAST